VIRELAPNRIVYVSCDSATLARDLKILCEDMYELKRVCACDMFPQSCHVETVCLLSNRKPDTKVRIDVDLEDYYRIKDAKKNQN
jgi:23S rRNA (uracil1939-C5)-methyltransferase